MDATTYCKFAQILFINVGLAKATNECRNANKLLTIIDSRIMITPGVNPRARQGPRRTEGR